MKKAIHTRAMEVLDEITKFGCSFRVHRGNHIYVSPEEEHLWRWMPPAYEYHEEWLIGDTGYYACNANGVGWQGPDSKLWIDPEVAHYLCGKRLIQIVNANPAHTGGCLVWLVYYPTKKGE
jgi:hypothetical protein